MKMVKDWEKVLIGVVKMEMMFRNVMNLVKKFISNRTAHNNRCWTLTWKGEVGHHMEGGGA